MQKNNKNMKIMRCLLTLFALYASILHSFDVKVLLQKNLIQECGKDPILLESEHGFIISPYAHLALGFDYAGNQLAISSHKNILYLNDKPLKDPLVYITPKLSSAQLVTIKSYISCWTQSAKKDLFEMAEMLYPLFDELVTAEKAVACERLHPINLWAMDVFTYFIQDLLYEREGYFSCTAQTLQAYAEQFLDKKPQNYFVDHVLGKHSKVQRADLNMDPSYRYQFLSQAVCDVAEKLLNEFVAALPRKIVAQIIEEPVKMMQYQGSVYPGSFLIFQEKKQTYFINSLDLDDYLLSVVKHEGWPTWSLEMNKVFAITSRTYLIWQVLQAQKIDRPYHIESGIKHQSYKGHVASGQIQQAIDETRDVFIAWGGKPALTMYDACCGGIVPGHIDDPDYQRVSYLARLYPCTFCKSYKIFNWSKHFSLDEITTRLKKELPKIENITDISVVKKDAAGLTKKIQITAHGRKMIITENKLKLLFPEIKSYCFDIIKNHKKYSFEGKGLGHHRGLCQWGANHLVKHEHWDYQEVLQFYYPGTTLMKLTYAK